ncbi:MAG: hypothetical protein Q7J35_03025 [Candidatus Methanoperedens sp.]|nr:hypothetical protein [Candidatus Methanoperedens sp.]
MGWSNFIIIPSLNIAIEVSRDLHDLEDYEEKAFDYLTSEEFDEGMDIENRTIRDLTVRDLASLYTTFDHTNSLKGMDLDKLLLFWLKNRGIDYEIKSEYEIEKEKLKEEGYTILWR